jgi:glycosyltransferase involved in cell wall biosynthesis
MRRRRFLFIEPSKVGSQHITLIEGYLRALLASEQLSRSFELSFLAADSTFAALSSAVRGAVRHIRIPVMNPEKRRLVRKTCVECYVVLRCLLRMRRGDVLFVSCVLPTTLLVLEACNRVLRRRGLFVELHGEIEGLFDRSMQGVRSFGFWVLQWMRLRRRGSLLSLVVIDDFIKSRLLQEYPGKLSVADIFVVHIPVSQLALAPMPAAEHAPGDGPGAHAPATVCFIGYRGRLKGFDQFMQLSESAPAASFVAIGGGKVEDVRSSHSTPIVGSDAYLSAIASCSVALFPYVAGYDCSLSAAALDALSAGVCIVASERACFVSLQQYFGSDMVTVCDGAAAMTALLRDRAWLDSRRAGQARRLERLAASKYGPDSVRTAFEALAATVSC